MIREIILAAIVSSGLASTLALAQERTNGRCAQSAAILESAEGLVQYQLEHSSDWLNANPGDSFCYGESLRVVEFRAAIRLDNDTLVRLKESSVVRFIPPDQSFWVELIKGAAHFISRTPKSFKVKAPYMNAAVEGTEFVVEHSQNGDSVRLIEGTVLVENAFGEVKLKGMQYTEVMSGRRPNDPINIEFADFADWTIYFPAIMETVNGFDSINDLVYKGNFSEALIEINEAISKAPSKDELYLLRTKLNLYLGKIAEAKKDLVYIKENFVHSSSYFALESMVSLIDLKRSESSFYIDLALKQDRLDPSTLLAYSYLKQSQGNVDAALSAIKTAHSLKSDPVIQARYIELLLMAGKYSSATTAVKEFPQQHFLHKRVRVFEAIIQLQSHKNEAALQLLATVESDDPLYHFILGLIKMRLGMEHDAKQSVELAVCLDPSNGLFRSYMGKVYSDQYRHSEALEQLNIATTLDENSPMPSYYKGLVYQSDIDLLSALSEFERSIEKYRGASVYRSETLMMHDLSTRRESIGRVYKDLALSKRAHVLASESLLNSTADYASHKLLSELYAGERLRRSASSMERGASVLLKPLGVMPTSKAVSDNAGKGIGGGGVTMLGVNEYSPLFIKEGLAARMVYFGDLDSSYTTDLAASLYGDQFQIALEHLTLENEGNHQNGDLHYDLSSLFTQWQLTTGLSMQLELNRTNTDHGDIYLRFNESDFSESYRETSEDVYKRLSVNYVDAHNTVVASTAVRDANSSRYQELILSTTDVYGDEIAEQNSLSWSFYNEIYSSLVGAVNYRLHDVYSDKSTLNLVDEENIDVNEFYFYNYIKLQDYGVDLTLGLELIDVDWDLTKNGAILDAPNKNSWLPKFGLGWKFGGDWSLRYAYGKSLGYRSEDLNYSLRPTKLAAFDQVFDGANTQLVTFSGGAVDYSSGAFNWGLSFMERDIDLPRFYQLFPPLPVYITLDTQLESKTTEAYFNVNFSKKVSLVLELDREVYRSEKILDPLTGIQIVMDYVPDEFDTRNATVNLSYQTCSRCLLNLNSNFVEQYFVSASSGKESRNQFSTVDLSFEYRFFKSRVTIGAMAKNIFDEDFHFYNPPIYATDIAAFEEQYIPKAAVFGYIRYDL